MFSSRVPRPSPHNLLRLIHRNRFTQSLGRTLTTVPDVHEYQDHLYYERRDLESFRRAFDRVSIPDSLERVVNQHMKIRLTGAETVYRMLSARGVRQVFGYSGGAVLPLIDQFHKSQRLNSPTRPIQFINTAHEQTAGHAAQAVGRVTGNPGVVIVTSGPGLTNCITAMQDALMDGDPMLVLSGQVPTSAMGSDAFQECPATALTKPCTKWNFLARDVESLPWAIDTGLRIAMSGRKGPVHIDLPKNVLVEMGDVPVPLVCPGGDRDMGNVAARRANARLLIDFDESLIDDVVNRIRMSQRPVLIVGHGAVEASHLINQLVAKANIPTTTTLHGVGILSELHPLALHMLGMHGSVYANLAVQNADTIISIGARFDDRTTGSLAKYAPKAREAAKRKTGGIVHFDIEPRQIGKTVKADASIIADCSYSIERLLSKMPEKQHPQWIETIDHWRVKYPFKWEDDAMKGTIKTQQVIESLYRASRHPQFLSKHQEISVCTGVGNHQMMTAQFFRWTRPRQLITSGGLGTMGSGLPFAIGTQVVQEGHTVLLIDGDGSFNMSSAELATVAQFNLPIKIAIMNDGVQQMVRAWQHLFFDARYVVTTNANPDYLKLAESYGIPALRCSDRNSLDQTTLQFLMSEGPMLIDFCVVPDFCLPMVKPGSALDEIIINKSQIVGKGNSTQFDPQNAPS